MLGTDRGADAAVTAREVYDTIDSFCYQGDMLGTDGGADAAVTTREV